MIIMLKVTCTTQSTVLIVWGGGVTFNVYVSYELLLLLIVIACIDTIN